MTSAPCAAKARAVSTPSPAETPVTRTRFPLKFMPRSTSSVVDVAPNESVMVKILSVFCIALPLHHEKWFNLKWREPPLNIRRMPPFCKYYFRNGQLNVNRKATPPARKPRADSARNRQSLIDAAKAGFAEVGLNVSLEEIARRAGVGIGTLYRHFPSREAVLVAVLPPAVGKLVGSKTQMVAPSPAGGAPPSPRPPLLSYICS